MADQIEFIGLKEGTPQLISAQANDDSYKCTVTLTANSGVESGLDLDVTIAQASTAGYQALLIAVTETGIGSGQRLPFEITVGGISKTSIDQVGIVNIPQPSAYNVAGYSLDANDSGMGLVGTKHPVIISEGVGVASFKSLTSTGLILKSTMPITWSSGEINASNDLRIYRDAADILAQRRDANPQEFRVYGDWASTSDYQRHSSKTKRTQTTVPSAASFTLSNFIPDGALLLGITSRVDTTCTTATGYDVGDGSDVDLWGSIGAVSAGTASGSVDFTASGASGPFYTSAQDVVITATGGNFDGTGVITVCAHYMITEAD